MFTVHEQKRKKFENILWRNHTFTCQFEPFGLNIFNFNLFLDISVSDIYKSKVFIKSNKSWMMKKNFKYRNEQKKFLQTHK